MLLEVVAILSLLIGVVAGIAIAAHQGPIVGGSEHSHPWIAAGVGCIAAVVVVGLFNWCVARAMRLFAVHVASEHVVEPPLR